MAGLAWREVDGEEIALCRLACESAAVQVAAQPTGNGMRLGLHSERSGETVLLDATVLEALCHLTPQRAVELIRERTEHDESEGTQ